MTLFKRKTLFLRWFSRFIPCKVYRLQRQKQPVDSLYSHLCKISYGEQRSITWSDESDSLGLSSEGVMSIDDSDLDIEVISGLAIFGSRGDIFMGDSSVSDNSMISSSHLDLGLNCPPSEPTCFRSGAILENLPAGARKSSNETLLRSAS